MTRVLILSPRHLDGYRDLVVAAAIALDESPVAVAASDDRTFLRVASDWLAVADTVAIYWDFGVEDVAMSIAEEAKMLGVPVDWRCLGSMPREAVSGIRAAYA